MFHARYRLSTRLSQEEFSGLDTLASSSRRDVKNQAAVILVSQLRQLGYLPIENGVFDPELLYPVHGEVEGATELRLINIRLNRDEYIALATCAKERKSGLRTQARELIRQGLAFHSLLPENAV